MALEKLFERINWKNRTAPAISAERLNKREDMLEEFDNRIIELDKTLTNLSDSTSKHVQDIKDDLDEQYTRLDGLDEKVSNAENTINGIEKRVELTEQDINSLYAEVDTMAPAIIGEVIGENPVITDGANRKLKSLKMYGNSKQYTTTGAQLLNLPDMTYSDSGITITIKDGKVNVSGTPTSDILAVYPYGSYMKTDVLFILPAGTYTASAGISLGSYDGTTRTFMTGTFTLTEEFPVTYVVFKSNEEGKNNFVIGKTYNIDYEPMVNTGDTALPWEPWCGDVMTFAAEDAIGNGFYQGDTWVEDTDYYYYEFVATDSVYYASSSFPMVMGFDGDTILTLPYNTSGGILKLEKLDRYDKVGIAIHTKDLATFKLWTDNKPTPRPNYPREIKPVKGKNELDCRGLEAVSANGGTITPVYDDNGNLLYVEVNGTFTAVTTYQLYPNSLLSDLTEEYVFTGCPAGGSTSTYRVLINKALADSTVDNTSYGTQYMDVGSGISLPACEYGYRNPRIVISSGYTADHLRFYPMIRPASVADDTYVPYGLLRFWGHGKNLFPNKSESGTISPDNGSELTDSNILRTASKQIRSGTHTISLKGDTLNLRLFYYDKYMNFLRWEDYTSVNLVLIGDRYSAQVDVKEDVSYFRARWSISANLSEIQLEAGTEATDYEPYTEFSHTLSQPIELNGINGVADDLVSGTRVVKKRRLLSSDGWVLHANGWLYTSSVDDFDYSDELLNGVHPSDGLCTHFNYYYDAQKVTADKSAGITMWYSTAYNGCRVAIYDSSFTTAEELTTFLDENEVYLYYPSAEPVTEPLPTADQIALNSLKSFNGVTYLYCDCGEVKPTWDVEYVVDTKTYIDNKFKELAVALVATGSEG